MVQQQVDDGLSATCHRKADRLERDELTWWRNDTTHDSARNNGSDTTMVLSRAVGRPRHVEVDVAGRHTATQSDVTLYVLYNLSYSYFCAEICKFSLPWQQGGLSKFLLKQAYLPSPKTLL